MVVYSENLFKVSQQWPNREDVGFLPGIIGAITGISFAMVTALWNRPRTVVRH